MWAFLYIRQKNIQMSKLYNSLRQIFFILRMNIMSIQKEIQIFLKISIFLIQINQDLMILFNLKYIQNFQKKKKSLMKYL